MSQQDWVKGREATIGELREQLAEAETARAEASVGVEAAEHDFDDKGTDAAAKAIGKARETEQLAIEHVARARRLLEAGEARAAEAERQRLLSRKAELEGQLSHQSVRGVIEPLLAQELALLEKVAEFRADKLARGEELRKAAHELLSVRQQLGEQIDGWAFGQTSNPLESSQELEKMVGERARKLDEPLRTLLRELAPAERRTFVGGIR